MVTKYSDIYRSILWEVAYESLESSPRWQKVREKLMWTFTYDPTQCIADFPSRPFSFKYLYWELLWYMSWDMSSNFIWDYASLWNRIADSQWNVNSNYWALVFHFQNHYEYTWYARAYQSLVNDKDSRQSVIFYGWADHQERWVKDFPCTVMQQFFIRDNKLEWITYMRSNDLFFWTSFDVVRFSLVMQSLHLDLKMKYPDLELWNMRHIAWSLHIYEKHFEKTDEIINAETGIKNYKITLQNSLTDLARRWIGVQSMQKTWPNTIDYIKELGVVIEECK